MPLDSASPGVDDTSMGVDSPNTIASGTSANGWEWSVTRDVRTRAKKEKKREKKARKKARKKEKKAGKNSKKRRRRDEDADSSSGSDSSGSDDE